jgi:hypothetical protein
MAGRVSGLATLALAIALLMPAQALATADFYASAGGSGDCMTPSTPADSPPQRSTPG